jgi:hypothetical protein
LERNSFTKLSLWGELNHVDVSMTITLVAECSCPAPSRPASGGMSETTAASASPGPTGSLDRSPPI